MDPIQIAVITNDSSIIGAVDSASLASGIVCTLTAHDSAAQYLESSKSCDLCMVDPGCFSLADHGDCLLNQQWVYLSKSNHVPIDALDYQPIAALNILDTELFHVKLNDLFRRILKEAGCADVVRDSSTIAVKRINGNMLSVDVGQIVYCRTNGDFVDIYLCGEGKDIVKVTVQERMKTLSTLLSGRGFVQVHRLWLVNIDAVIDNHPYPKDEITLDCGVTIPLARRRKLRFLTAYRAR